MKLKSGLITFLFACLVAGSSAFAADWVKYRVGYWNVAANWVGGLPNGTTETKIRWNAVPHSVCTLNSVEDWGTALSGNRMSIYDGSTLNIWPDASLTGPGWFRVGRGGSAGTVNQSGGTITLKQGQDTSKLVIGDEGGPGGIYNMTGGTITYATGDGQLVVGDRGGRGTFTVSGTAPVIQMQSFYVGGRSSSSPGNGTLQYNVDAGGVSTIHCTLYTKLDMGGASYTANLVVNFSATPTDPLAPIVLIENTGSLAVIGLFDTFNGGSAEEGKCVSIGGYIYSLTYYYDAATNTCGTGNDIALIPGITIPTPSTNVGDLLIAAIATEGDTSDSIAPIDPSWTLIDRGTCDGEVTLGVWWKLAGASEPSHTFIWSTGDPQQVYGWMMRFTGHNSADPINNWSAGDGSGNSPISPAVITTVDNCVILRLGAFDDEDITINDPSLLSGHITITMDESASTSGGTVSGGAGYVRQLASGSSGPATFSLGSANVARMLTIAIAPDSNGQDLCCEGLVKP